MLAPDTSPDSSAHLSRIMDQVLRDSGVASQEAFFHYQQAMPCLQLLPPGIGRDHLALIASQLVQRNT